MLDVADKLASVASAVFGLAALILTGYSVGLHRHPLLRRLLRRGFPPSVVGRRRARATQTLAWALAVAAFMSLAYLTLVRLLQDRG
ncbi:hypothetical protein [Saccharopolyspora phatthalungensis]|uniref:Uncharacterized protein n=1 Tax=Saccharopolyspora phatthalungensis TaxID=664693 RepID=A0A840QJV6_9PSEU|nr:hypothetical protein [Saccharopolyspora phatthalungensis]MBB5159688.1 hypothetical protein [Saccharopolyspora phatthalungensis]